MIRIENYDISFDFSGFVLPDSEYTSHENVIKEMIERYNREQMLDLRSRKNGKSKLY